MSKTQTQPDKATARPWKLIADSDMTQTSVRIGCITDSTGERPIASVNRMKWMGSDLRAESQANAALIVKAVNEHAALVAVAEAAERHSESCASAMASDETREMKRSDLNDALANLAAVRGEGSAK